MGIMPNFNKYKQSKMKNEFQWTDELVDEYALRMEKESLTVELFKKSKEIKEPEIIEVKNIKCIGGYAKAQDKEMGETY